MKHRYIAYLVLIAISGAGAYFLGTKSGSDLGAYYFGSNTSQPPNDGYAPPPF